MRHIECKWFFIQDLVRKGFITVHKETSARMIADMLTKNVNVDILNRHRHRLGVFSNAEFENEVQQVNAIIIDDSQINENTAIRGSQIEEETNDSNIDNTSYVPRGLDGSIIEPQGSII